MLRRFAVFGILALMNACAAFPPLPADGPSAGKVEVTAERAPQGPFPIIALDKQALMVLEKAKLDGLSVFTAGPYAPSAPAPRSDQLQPGDVVDVTIFDTGEAGLFSSTQAKSLALGNFSIDDSGNLALPFVGNVDAAGMTTGEVQGNIVAGLRGRAVSPQAAVRLVAPAGGDAPPPAADTFTVNGDASKPDRYALADSERVLDGIAIAGGSKHPAGETEVTLIRGQRQSRQSLDKIVADGAQNVFLAPGDQIFLRHDPPSFTAFGAIKTPGEFPFEVNELTLVQALAKVGGLDDERANPRGVYVFRYESAVVAFELGLPVEVKDTRPIPLIYKLDTTRAASYFVMQSFLMKDGDIMFVTNSPYVQLEKFFEILQKIPKPAVAIVIEP